MRRLYAIGSGLSPAVVAVGFSVLMVWPLRDCLASEPAESKQAPREQSTDGGVDNPTASLSRRVDQYREARDILDHARSLRCSFPKGARVDLADPKLQRHEGAGVDVTFDAVDRKAGRARVIAKEGAADVTVIPGATALTFVEMAPTGNPLITVVFPRFRDGTRELLAADSEHIFFFGDVTVSQYYGSCAVLE